jgi:hypothetical protein
METRKSFRLIELAQRHSLSLAFIYKEIAAGHLNARKAGSCTIVTDEDEAAWLDAMPTFKPSGHAAPEPAPESA